MGMFFIKSFLRLLLASIPSAWAVSCLYLFMLFDHGRKDFDDIIWLSLLVAGIGHIIVAPSLFLFFFPWSSWQWFKSIPSLSTYIATGMFAATLNGYIFTAHPKVSPFNWQELIIFSVTGALTALVHWVLMYRQKTGEFPEIPV